MLIMARITFTEPGRKQAGRSLMCQTVCTTTTFMYNSTRSFIRMICEWNIFKQSLCAHLFIYLFHSSFIATVHFQILHECERPAASESKEDLESLFVAAVTATHQWLALSVVTCLNGSETADDVSRPMSSALSLHLFCACFGKQCKGYVKLFIFKAEILALDSSHSKTDGLNSNLVLAVPNKSRWNLQSATLIGNKTLFVASQVSRFVGLHRLRDHRRAPVIQTGLC